ncbi:UNVERIFIED_CONTAM: Structural maintenance of chromosomes protein 2-1 [Sesamum latifolium]|uniref:Structural maintenance of chromosomes protein 2-1 n=1 Tax=Sesamum latifolium TaxID=2727402 RepID=A0AAW2T858_9LAMI
MALAPKPLSLSSLSAFRTHYSFQNPHPKPFSPKFNCQKPLTFIICKSTQTDTPNSPFSTPEPDGSGPSAPTRGDLFLQRHQSSAASATVLAEITEKKKKNKQKAAKASSFTGPSCYGCGAPLQTSEADAPGYVEVETYNLASVPWAYDYCCLGNGGYSGGKQFVSAEELREKLSHLRHEKALVVKLVDVVDFNGSFLARVRDLAGANPIILVVTKVDLLPKGTDLNCVGDWVVEATVKKKLNVLSVHLTSSKSLVGIAGVISEIQKEKKGSANVGKSAFINALLKMLSYKDPVAAAARKYKPIQSAVPGTTLGPIQIEAFLSGGKLYDTPGVHLHHRQAAVIHSEDLPALAPQSRLRGKSFPALQIHVVPTEDADKFYEKEVGIILTPPTGKQKAESWMGLETKRELQLKYDDIDRPACDVAISGLGWISVEPFSQSLRSSKTSAVEAGGEISLVVHVPKPVEIFVRPPLPVGSAGAEWYQYRELTEMEQEFPLRNKKMYIKEICLEGFKSYATRTVVPGFDPYFNAITGLNGSGKSNILDSICFVLGITNLQQVRASNLQELVYKQGQAGITKATVSIVFDNSDRSRSPLGYEDSPEITVTRQIVVGGRNKYLINGHLAQPSRVQNLFHSVQLNVNNPHFLIMQGRITKVLNMKPPEILSMLEEAAGTRMYENKKEAALKTLEKKQSKVDEIDKLLDQEILPALEKLRKERMQYMQWANGNAELDRLKRFCIAYEYVQAEKIRDNAVQCVQEIRDKILEIDATVGKMHEESQGMENRVSELSAEKEANMGGEIKLLSDKLDALSRDLVKETSVLKNEEDNLRTEEENAAKIERSLEESKLAAEEMAAAVKNAEDGAADLKKSFQDLSKILDEHEKEYQGVVAGKSSGNEEKCLDDQLGDAKIAVGRAETELKQLQTKVSHCEKELEEKKTQLLSTREKASLIENELDVKRKDVEKVKSALESLPYEENIMEALQKDRTAELEMVQKFKEEVRIISSQLANVEFNYNDPEKNFDKSRVKGVVAKLIKVKDSSAVVALEVAAGGKLFNVVVDTENTGKQLLQKGGLRRRVTIIPLNKIQSHPVPQRVKTAAVKLVGKGNAEVALSLVGYDPELQSAMEYVFGSTFVCKTIDAAREVAFNKETGTPSVTLEGDIFQPSGLLTGGSRKGGGDLLRKLHALGEAELKLSFHQKRLSELDAKINELLPLQRKFKDLKTQLELKSHDLSLSENRAKQNEHHKLGELVKRIEDELGEAKSAIKEKKLLYEECVAKVSSLEKSIHDHAGNRESRLKDLGKD